jgi:hypothetical protein
MPGDRPNVSESAPLGYVELAAFERDGTPISFRPCRECAPSWRAEVMNKDGFVLVREWHAADCEALRMLKAKAAREE